jgi:hypothetical protein
MKKRYEMQIVLVGLNFGKSLHIKKRPSSFLKNDGGDKF